MSEENVTSCEDIVGRLIASGVSLEQIESGEDVERALADGGLLAERPAQVAAEDAAPQSEAKSVEDEDADVCSYASVIDQFERYPETCRVSAPEDFVFNLSDSAELKRWNELQADIIISGTRRGNKIISADIHFHGGAFYVRATVRTITYERLVPGRKPA